MRFWFPCIFIVLVACSVSLSNPERQSKQVSYLNWNDSATYVGIDKCLLCHSEVNHTFSHTGMGKSFRPGDSWHSDANFSHPFSAVYDSILDFYYTAFLKDTLLYVREYRLKGLDTVHNREERIDYIIGSGHHTNSHLTNRNGYIFQVPITFYTQQEKWDLAPGFEGGFNSRFSRYIGEECMQCHNAKPTLTFGSENKYDHIPMGIDCERCHGPGSIHIDRMMNEQYVDTSLGIDSSIVNPSDLSIELQNNLCQRCHLQGVSVLKKGKTYDDFRPGMYLSEVMDVYLPDFEGADNEMIMASHVQRLKKSECFKSKKMSCLTCHTPHKSVKATAAKEFDAACFSCHSKTSEICKSQDCASCHMPKNESIDIPHIAVTDHWIRIPGTLENSDKKFKGLVALNNENPAPNSRAKAYLNYYEKYSLNQDYLDSAARYATDYFEESVHLAYLRKDHNKLVELSRSAVVEDSWTAYRIAQGYSGLKMERQALEYYRKAIEFAPLNLRMQLAYGSALFKLGQRSEALKVFRFITLQDRKNTKALGNIGYLMLLEKEYEKAEEMFKKALALDPDYLVVMKNLIALYQLQARTKEAQYWIQNYERAIKRQNG